MILTPTQSLITILVIAVTTFATRIIPFILFPDNRETPEFIRYLGDVLPYSVIGMLVIYCLKNVSISSRPFALPEFGAILSIVLLHKWKRNTLLSIAAGTIIYMFLAQKFI